MTSDPLSFMLASFDYLFINVIDLFYIIIDGIIVALISRSRWKHHQRWAVPQLIAAILFGLVRLTKDVHHFFGVGSRLLIDEFVAAFYYPAVIIGACAAFIFLRMLKDAIKHSEKLDLLTAPDEHPGVWPPPPTINH